MQLTFLTISSLLGLALAIPKPPTDIPYVTSTLPTHSYTCASWTTTTNHQGAVLPKCALWRQSQNPITTYTLNGLPKSFASKCSSKTVDVQDENVTVQCDKKAKRDLVSRKAKIEYIDYDVINGWKQKCNEWVPKFEGAGVVKAECREWVEDAKDFHYLAKVALLKKGYCQTWVIETKDLPRLKPICAEK